MRKVFQEIVCHNIHKAVRIQKEDTNENDLRKKLEQIDLSEMFLTEYIILAIHLNSQGVLSDVVLNKVKENADLMI